MDQTVLVHLIQKPCRPGTECWINTDWRMADMC